MTHATGGIGGLGGANGPGGGGTEAQRGAVRLGVTPDRSVVLVSTDQGVSSAVRAACEAGGLGVSVAAGAGEAGPMARSGSGVVLVDAAAGVGLGPVVARLAESESVAAWVLVDPAPTAERAVAAVRLGARDVVSPSSPAELAERVSAVIDAAAAERAEGERRRRAASVCAAVTDANEGVGEQLGAMAGDLAEAYTGLREQMGELALASELNGVLRQELEVESLLRTFLEFLLARVGSTNAGVFLPSSAGEFTLGAYINYDVPKASAEAMLDALANEMAPRFQNREGVAELRTPEDVQRELGECAHWLEGHAGLVVACHEPGEPTIGAGEGGGVIGGPAADGRECLAVVCLFRDRKLPFGPASAGVLRVAGRLFGQQLARVIKVHHRASPADAGDDGLDWAA